MPKAAVKSCYQTTVLRFLAGAGPQSLDTICKAVLGKAAPVGSQARKNVRQAVGKLMAPGLVVRQGKPNSSLRNQAPAFFVATKAGRDFIAADKTITSGPKGPHTGVPTKSAGMRQRLWHAMRLKQKFTMLEIIELVHRQGDPDAVKVTDNLRKYLKRLVRAQIVKEFPSRAPGYGSTSNGFKRFALLRDLGPQAPLTGKAFVTDPNAADSSAARIFYPAEKH